MQPMTPFQIERALTFPPLTPALFPVEGRGRRSGPRRVGEPSTSYGSAWMVCWISCATGLPSAALRFHLIDSCNPGWKSVTSTVTVLASDESFVPVMVSGSRP